eukprot:jgi/Tetstr1/454148/TSEL_041067.t1
MGDPGDPGDPGERASDWHTAPCGCPAATCKYGDTPVRADDNRPAPTDEAGARALRAERCAELEWPMVARTILETERLMNDDRMVLALDEWIRNVVTPRWTALGADVKRRLRPSDFDTIHTSIHRVMEDRYFRLLCVPVYKPLMRFAMKAACDADPDTAPSIWIKMPAPVRWIEATRRESGRFEYPYDRSSVPVDPASLGRENYGVTWAEPDAFAVVRRRPAFMSPGDAQRLDARDRHWYVFSAGLEGWLPAQWTDEKGWIQHFRDRDESRVAFPVTDVPYGEYGVYTGVLAPLYDGNLERVYDRLVLHPQYRTGWQGVYERGGRLFAYSYPEDVEVPCDLSPEQYNVTWCWPPCLVRDT